MTDRILDLSERSAYLRVQHRQLILDRKDEDSSTVPLKELAVLILAHPQVTCTQAVLSGLMEEGGALIACDQRNLPVGLMLPTQAHSTQSERFAAQAAAPLPAKKRLWKQIVRAKVRAQARLLQLLRGDDWGLSQLVATVRSGDPTNIEAQAAARYWPALFNDDSFRRRREGDDQNRMLNYGYAVLRATMGRAICATGLHPSLGLHHHNRYNPFCLADDLMEPYRPVVDEAVVEILGNFGTDGPLDRAVKQMLLEPFTAYYLVGGETRKLFDLIARTASSLAKVFVNEGKKLFFPEGLQRAAE